MAQPYGITQVNVPGIVAAYQDAQKNRIEQLMAQKQLEQFDQKMGAMKAIQAYLGGGDASQASPQAATASPASSGASAPVNGAGAAPAASQAPVAAAPAAPQTPGSAFPQGPAMPNGNWQHLVGTLMAFDPATAATVADTYSKMSAAQLAESQAKSLRVSQLAAGLMQINPAERRAALQQAAPELEQYGFTPQMVQNFNPTDENLRSVIAQHSDQERIAAMVNPQVVSVQQGGSAVAVSPSSGTGHVLYQSPTMVVGGDVYQTPHSDLPKVTSAKDYSDLPNGAQFIDPDGHVRVKGGQSGAPAGGFPVNNPGALRVPGSMEFQHFSSPQEGVQAQQALLGRYMSRGLNNVASIVETYAPRRSRGGDNSDASVNNYIAYVARRIGVDPAQPIGPNMVGPLSEAMREFETGRRAN